MKIKFGPKNSSGRRAAIRRNDDGQLDVGTVCDVEDGKPIPTGADLIQVRDDDCGCDGWHETETLYTNPGSGPAQVATPAYREGYDRIFGKKTVGLA